jgi:beta-galactosidase
MQKTDFNRDWTVQKDGSTEILHVNLPDDAMIREERSKENKTASASAYFAGGKYIYTKIFNLSEDETRQTLILEFEAVYQNAIVFLNGRQVAERPYGYTNFFVDITGKVIAGTNELKVVADNADVPNSRWYSGSGIYREVHLYRSESSYIRPEGLKVQIVDLNTIHIFADAVMQPNEKIVLEIFSDSGKIASAEGTDVTITIPDAHLWSSEDPYLYTCQATLLQGGTVIDTAKSSFGIRTLSWGKDGFLVNNNPVLFRGACIHHDNGVLGACGFHDAEFRRVRILKEAGFNAIRSSHNPISKAMLDACDKLGMYVIDEAFDMWLIKKNPYDYAGEKFSKWWKDDIAAMISKDYNHPSVVMYSIGNEITELGLATGQEQARIMTEFCHTQDHTRPVTAGINLMLATMAKSKKSIYGTDEDGNVKNSGTGGMDDAPTSEFFNIMMNKMGGNYGTDWI